MDFNLLDEQWIPVLYHNGRWERVEIRKALEEAGQIRQIAASNPMDNVSLLRFLLAVLVWCKGELTENDRKLLEGNTDGVPEDWLKKLDDYVEKFNLLGNGERFFQDVSLKGHEDRPIADLLVEFPGADSVNHTRHVLHGSYGFCPACCAMGVLRFSVWAPANRYYPASVNPGSAAYAIAAGDNLLRTFAASLPDDARQTTEPPWLSDSPPALPLETATALAWRPRKLWLGDNTEKGLCANCGSHCGLTKVLAFAGGWPTPQTQSQSFAKLVEQHLKSLGHRAKDPEVQKAVKAAWVILNCRMDELHAPCGGELRKTSDAGLSGEQSAKSIANALDDILKKNEKAFQNLVKKASKEETAIVGPENLRQKKFWEADPQLLTSDNEALSLPRLEADAGVHARFWRSAFRARPKKRNGHKLVAVGPVVNQFAYQDATTVPIPDTSAERQMNLSGDVGDELFDLLKQVTLNPELRHPEIRAALALLSPETEAQVRVILGKHDAVGDDREFLRSTFGPVVQKVIASTLRGSGFQRRLALNEAGCELERVINQKIRARKSTGSPKKGATL